MAAHERTNLLGRHDGRNTPPEEKAHFNLVGLSQRSFWTLCLSCWATSFMNAFDGTVVATLVGPISSSFLASNLGSWLGTTYMLAVCCCTPIYGRLCDIIGRRTSFLIAISFFFVGNTLCAIAPSMYFIIAARAIAGIGGGGLSNLSSTIMSDIVPINHRGIFQGYGNIAFCAGLGFGAPIGGFINDSLGWRWAFWLQLPIICLSMSLVWTNVRYDPPGRKSSELSFREAVKKIDFLGCFLLAVWLSTILIALSIKLNATDTYAWTSPTILGLLITSGVAFALLMIVEFRFAAIPVMPFELLKRQTPIAVAVNNFVVSVSAYATIYSAPLFFMAVRQLTSAQAGQRMILGTALGMFGSLASGFAVRATGKYYWLNMWMGLLGVLSTAILVTWSTQTPDWLLWISLSPLSLCGGAVTTLTIVALIADVGPEHVAMATSLSYLFRTVGQVVGVSMSGILTQAVLQSQLARRIHGEGAEEIIRSIRQSSSGIRFLPPDIRQHAIDSWRAGLHAVFVVCFILSITGVIAGLGIREVDMSAERKAAPLVEEEDDA